MKCLTPHINSLGFPSRPGGVYIPKSIQGIQALIAWRNEHADAPDAWLRQDICTAFQFMIGLNLGKPPAAELMPFTAETWTEIIGEGMTEEQDRERIRAGFKILRRGLKWWPQPEALLKVLPRRQTGRGESCIRPQEQQSETDHARGSAAFKEILANLSNGMKVKTNEALDRKAVEQMKRDFLTKTMEHGTNGKTD